MRSRSSLRCGLRPFFVRRRTARFHLHSPSRTEFLQEHRAPRAESCEQQCSSRSSRSSRPRLRLWFSAQDPESSRGTRPRLSGPGLGNLGAISKYAPLRSTPLRSKGRLMPSLPEEPIQGEDCWGGAEGDVPDPFAMQDQELHPPSPMQSGTTAAWARTRGCGGGLFFCCQASASVSGMSGWRPCCRRAASFFFCALSASLLPLLKDGTLGLLLHGTSVVGFCSEEAASHGWPGVPRGLRRQSQGEGGGLPAPFFFVVDM